MAKIGSTVQMGIFIPGPGGIRFTKLTKNLCSLTPDQFEQINKAKKYALEQSVKTIYSSKQTSEALEVQQTGAASAVTGATAGLAPGVTVQAAQRPKSSQKYQALVFMCRVYVGGIAFDVTEEMIKAAFALFGAIKSINMSYDSVTGKHKGFAFVEYELPEAAQLALDHMNGIQLGSRQIKCGRPSNMPQAAPVIQKIQEEVDKKHRVYVSNVHLTLSEGDLATLFEPFGTIKLVQLASLPPSTLEQSAQQLLPTDANHRGYGFIEFENEAAANESLTIDNFDLGGQVIHVCRATTPIENMTPHGTLQSEPQSQLINPVDPITPAPSEEVSSQATTDVAISEQDSGKAKAASTTNGVTPESSIDASNIILLRNMIDANEELDDNLQLDVFEECSKHGPVRQVVIYLDKAAPDKSSGEVGGASTEAQADSNGSGNKDQVKIFVKYQDKASSMRARQALDGRFFAGRKVQAELYPQDRFRLSDYSQ